MWLHVRIRGYLKNPGGDRRRQGTVLCLLFHRETGDSEPSPSYYVKPRALIYKVLRQLTISLYLSKQS